MSLIEFEVDLEGLHKKFGPEVQGILQKKMKGLPVAKSKKNLHELWSAQSFAIDHTTVYQGLNIEQKEKVLSELARYRLEEAFHIEKCGIAYGAKMILASNTIDHRKLYAKFTAEESEHLEMVQSFLPDVSEEHCCNPFLQLLAEVISSGARMPLIFIIQVILEGWGLEHYTHMKNTCIDEDLEQVLKRILHDEASHHGSGVQQFNETLLSESERNFILEILSQFFEMVRVGPLSIVNAFKKVLPNMNSEDIQLLLNQLQAQEDTQRKLNSLASLMRKAGANGLLDEMSKRGKLRTCTIDQMVGQCA